ncbi:MAG: biotin--[acetyl-CoA-carboxylase] ligase [Bullifex sp.]
MTTKEKVLSLLEENRSAYISGEEMAVKLSVSRASVWKAVKALEDDGYIIEGVTKKGYRLVLSDIMSEEILSSLIPVPVHYYPEIDSTNNEAKRLAAAGVKPPFAVIAERQTGGRGRRGRSFISERGGTYFTLCIGTSAGLDTESVTTRSALAIADTIASLGFSPQIKWVNDVYLNGKKCVGILTEGIISIEENRVSEVLIGIGVNYMTSSFPEELQDICTSLYPDTVPPVSRAQFLAMEIRNVLSVLEERDYIKRYRELCFVIGRDVDVIRLDEKRRGHCIDVDDSAHLVVTFPDGHTEHISSGEVSVRPVENLNDI